MAAANLSSPPPLVPAGCVHGCVEQPPTWDPSNMHVARQLAVESRGPAGAGGPTHGLGESGKTPPGAAIQLAAAMDRRPMRLDHLLISKLLVAANCHVVLTDPAPSDHYGLMADVAWIDRPSSSRL